MRIVRERTLRIKEIWELDEDGEVHPALPIPSTATLVSTRQAEVGATLLYVTDASEDPWPADDPKHQEAADRGYWSRLMKAWRSR